MSPGPSSPYDVESPAKISAHPLNRGFIGWTSTRVNNGSIAFHSPPLCDSEPNPNHEGIEGQRGDKVRLILELQD